MADTLTRPALTLVKGTPDEDPFIPEVARALPAAAGSSTARTCASSSTPSHWALPTSTPRETSSRLAVWQVRHECLPDQRLPGRPRRQRTGERLLRLRARRDAGRPARHLARGC